MNPFLFKAHPLLYRSVELLIHPFDHTLDDFTRLVLIFLIINLLWAAGLPWAVRRAAAIRVSLLQGYFLALPATVLYAPLVVTVLSDVVTRTFEMQNRFLLVFSILVVSQMLAGFYAFFLRQGRRAEPVGLVAGVTVSLFLLLVSLPACGVLLGLDRVLRIF
jgi:hypothetical protein